MMAAVDKVRAVLSSPDDEAAAESLASDDAAILWVDWRDEDDGIVNASQKYLRESDTVSATWIDRDDGSVGVTITHNGVETEVPYPEPHADRDTTLITLAQVLAPAYGLRWYADSLGSDTLGFVILPMADWAELDAEFTTEVMDHAFVPVVPGSRMFELGFDEVFALLDQRAGREPQERRRLP